MSIASPPLFAFESSYADALPELSVAWQGAQVPDPRLLALNEELAAELGVDAAELRSPAGVDVLAGRSAVPGSTPVAQAYAGHQFGGYSPRLGDGRALLLGEVADVYGRRRDIHLKGSGRTPFARGGDGKAAVGPMLREYVVGEAMHAFGIPTTRALAVVATGEGVVRETVLPGAVLARVAASHLRVGTFEYAARRGEELVRRLADYAIARHHPRVADAGNPYLALLECVVAAQAALVARWMHVGFIHGVMNTDNMTISGETIDFGPCAFMDAYDPATVFSSIDHQGRYAFGNQPHAAQWNLARLAETLLALIDPDQPTAIEQATAVVHGYAERFQREWLHGMRAKVGLDGERDDDAPLIVELLTLMQEERADYTRTFRALAAWLRGDESPIRALVADGERFDAWSVRWRERVGDAAAAAAAMDAVNPLYIPRNHRVEEALAAATAGDLEPFERLVEVVRAPFERRPGLERFEEPAPTGDRPYVTYCGT